LTVLDAKKDEMGAVRDNYM